MQEKEFTLIEGIFEPDDALKVVSAVISSKINYHNLDAFSNSIRFNDDGSHSKKRVEALKNNLEDLKKSIEMARIEGKKVKIDSQILIQFV